VKTERLRALQELLTAQQHAFQRACVGRTVDLLLEKPGRREGQMVGRSPWLQPTVVDAGASRIGEIITVRITASGTNSLFAERIGA
jgi:tRNA-2-methylthio-N6-dimethylallyladenosine synthase